MDNFLMINSNRRNLRNDHRGKVPPLVIGYRAIEHGQRIFVSFPSYKMVIFYNYVNLPEGKFGVYLVCVCVVVI